MEWLVVEALLSLLGLAVMLFFIFSTLSFFLGAPFVSAEGEVVRKMIEMAEIGVGERGVDLGSGDGRIVFAAAERGTEMLGVEINPILFLWSKLRGIGKRNARFVCGNFFDFDLKDADVVFFYAWPSTNEKMKKKFEKELKKGSRIVTYRFPIERWEPVAVDGEKKIYKYRR